MGDVMFSAGALADFLGRYADFIWEMCDVETEMLASMARGDIPAMEKGMNLSSANQKRMAKFEADRQALQAAGGCQGRTLRETVDSLDEAGRQPALEALDRFEAGLVRLRFLNDKAMAATKQNLAAMDGEAAPLTPPAGGVDGKPISNIERKI